MKTLKNHWFLLCFEHLEVLGVASGVLGVSLRGPWGSLGGPWRVLGCPWGPLGVFRAPRVHFYEAIFITLQNDFPTWRLNA